MAAKRITHVSKDYLDNITAVGQRNIWQESTQSAIAYINAGINTYYVQEVNPAVAVRVVNGTPPYLRTDADSTSKNNLDNLPPL